MEQIVAETQAQLEQRGWQFTPEQLPPNYPVIINRSGEIVGDLANAVHSYKTLYSGGVASIPAILLRDTNQVLYAPYRVTFSGARMVLMSLSSSNAKYRVVVNENGLESWTEQ